MLEEARVNGTVCDGVTVDAAAVSVGRGARVLSLTVVRLDADRFIAVLTDITEWNRLEIERGQREIALQAAKAELERLSKEFAKALEPAEEANQSKMRLLAGMSHELRTPLNGILGYNRLLSMEGGLSQMQLGRVKAMQEAGEHLLEMISTLLDLSAIEMNNMA